MSQKITTAACKQALAKAWPEIFGNDLADASSKWKRISKRGKKGEPIERLFYHDSLPLQALVVEEAGAITKTVIRGFAPFDADEESKSPVEADMAKRANSNEAFTFLEKYRCFKPSDFTFKVCSQQEAEEQGTWYELYPTRDFGRGACDFDAVQLDYLIAAYLPEGDSEAVEGTFATERSVAEAHAELARLGFIPEKDFVPTSKGRSSGEDE